MNTLTPGASAPAFTLKDQHDNDVSLSQFAGEPVLVYFYPKAMTPGCTVQAQGLRDIHDELAALKVTVLGISPDPSAKLLKFADKHELNFTLLSDEDHAIADAFGVWGLKKFMGKEFDGIHRLSFLIDGEGKIAKVFDGTNKIKSADYKFKTKTHHEVVLEALQAYTAE